MFHLEIHPKTLSFLPESARWLVSEQKFKAAAKELSTIGRGNGKKVDEVELRFKCMEAYRNSKGDKEHSRRHNLFDLFRTPNLRKKTLIITYVWLVNAVTYNGLTLNVGNLPVNDYLSFAINGAVELPAYFIIWPLLNQIGRRWPLCLSMLIGGIACLLAVIAPNDQGGWVVSGLAFVGKFGIAASFSIIYIFAGELYPTVVRAVGMGMSSMVAGMGLILGPELVTLGARLPLLIMGVLTFTAGIASMFLPETLGAHLPQTILEAENFDSVGQSFWHCGTIERNQAGEEDGNDTLSVPV